MDLRLLCDVASRPRRCRRHRPHNRRRPQAPAQRRRRRRTHRYRGGRIRTAFILPLAAGVPRRVRKRRLRRGTEQPALGAPQASSFKGKSSLRNATPGLQTPPNKAARDRLVRALPQNNPALAQDFDQARRAAEATSLFARASGRFALTGRGDINTYSVFTETAAPS